VAKNKKFSSNYTSVVLNRFFKGKRYNLHNVDTEASIFVDGPKEIRYMASLFGKETENIDGALAINQNGLLEFHLVNNEDTN